MSPAPERCWQYQRKLLVNTWPNSDLYAWFWHQTFIIFGCVCVCTEYPELLQKIYTYVRFLVYHNPIFTIILTLSGNTGKKYSEKLWIIVRNRKKSAETCENRARAICQLLCGISWFACTCAQLCACATTVFAIKDWHVNLTEWKLCHLEVYMKW